MKAIPSDADFDERFDNEESVMPYADLGKAVRPNKVKRVNMDFPAWMVDAMDSEAEFLHVPRQALIKMWLADCLKEKGRVSAQA